MFYFHRLLMNPIFETVELTHFFSGGRTAQELAQVMGWNVDLEGTNWADRNNWGSIVGCGLLVLPAESHENNLESKHNSGCLKL